MKPLLMLALLPLLSVQAATRHTEVHVDASSLTERACYYEGNRYSEGAVLEDEGGIIRCGVLDGVTENGALGWLREGETDKAVIEQRQDETKRVIEIRK